MEISAWVLSDGTENGGDRIFVHVFDQAGVGFGTYGPPIPLDLPFWRKVSVKVDIPTNAVRIVFGVSMASKRGSLWVDDVSVKADGKEILKNGSFEDQR